MTTGQDLGMGGISVICVNYKTDGEEIPTWKIKMEPI